MRVSVALFGATAETVGSRQVDVDVHEGATVRALLGRLACLYPKFKTLLPPAGDGSLAQQELEDYFTLVVRGQLVPAVTQLREGDKVMVLMAISGG